MFRPHVSSIDTCLSRLMDIILNNAKNGKHADMILINLQKVFETLDYKTLLDKLKYISVSDKALKPLLHKLGFFRFIGQCVFKGVPKGFRTYCFCYI